MIDITNREPTDCFAIGERKVCGATGERAGNKCKICCFYKPRGFDDYVRIEEDGYVHLYTVAERYKVLYGKENS